MKEQKEDSPASVQLILASASPRRKELLDQMRLSFLAVPSQIDETGVTHSDPVRLAKRLAAVKATTVRDGADARYRSCWIVGADTIVAVGGETLGKPMDRDDAKRMMRILAGRSHLVITGLAVLVPGRTVPVEAHAETRVAFAAISDSELDRYIESDDWRDVAGGYRIQGLSACYINWISGSYSNVVGLPIHLVYSILTGHGYQSLR